MAYYLFFLSCSKKARGASGLQALAAALKCYLVVQEDKIFFKKLPGFWVRF